VQHNQVKSTKHTQMKPTIKERTETGLIAFYNI